MADAGRAARRSLERVNFNFTAKCNMACRFCYVPFDGEEGSEVEAHQSCERHKPRGVRATGYECLAIFSIPTCQPSRFGRSRYGIPLDAVSSDGPGRVSSKSLRSNSSRRSGEAKARVRQMGVPAQLHLEAGGGGGGQVGGHDLGRPPVEGEGRDQHPPVPDRDQVGLPGRVLLLQQRHRVGAVGGRRPSGVAVRRRPVPSLPTPRPPLLDAQVHDLSRSHRPAPPRHGAVHRICQGFRAFGQLASP